MSDLYLANGRRKESVARVQLKKGKGEIKVNSHLNFINKIKKK